MVPVTKIKMQANYFIANVYLLLNGAVCGDDDKSPARVSHRASAYEVEEGTKQ